MPSSSLIHHDKNKNLLSRPHESVFYTVNCYSLSITMCDALKKWLLGVGANAHRAS